VIYALLALWIVSALLILRERRIARIIIYLGIFSLISAVCYLLLGSPDVAMAEAATSIFSTVFFIICFEKYFGYTDTQSDTSELSYLVKKAKWFAPLLFVIGLFGLFVYFMPYGSGNDYLKVRYLSSFMQDVGGENAVTAIYLAYRVYDTLFEALVLIISVVAVIHLSAIGEETVRSGRHSEVESSGMAVFVIQIICPVMLLFGIYLILNGHITPGGGFQGGLAIASFFVCRYMIYDIYDLPIDKLNRMEEIVFAGIVLLAGLIVFMGFDTYLPEAYRHIYQTTYLIVMNGLIGLKVACGFIILFYRYIAIERERD